MVSTQKPWFWRHFWSIRYGLQTSPRLRICLWDVFLRFLTPSRCSLWLLSNTFLFLFFPDLPSSYPCFETFLVLHEQISLIFEDLIFSFLTREDRKNIKIKNCSTKAIQNIVKEPEIEGKLTRVKCEAWGWFAIHLGCFRNASKTMKINGHRGVVGGLLLNQFLTREDRKK